jgi:hypothetical protein
VHAHRTRRDSAIFSLLLRVRETDLREIALRGYAGSGSGSSVLNRSCWYWPLSGAVGPF